MRQGLSVSFGSCIVRARWAESSSEVLSEIDRRGSSVCILADAQNPQAYLFLEIASIGVPKPPAYVAMPQQSSISPQVAMHRNQQAVWFGYDSTITLLALARPEVQAKVELVGLLWDIVYLEEGPIVVIHELGAVCLDDSAKTMWTIDGPDMLDAYDIEGDTIACHFMDGTVLRRQVVGIV